MPSTAGLPHGGFKNSGIGRENTMVRHIRHGTANRQTSVLEGAPAWITPEMLADTLVTWQPYYDEQLTETEALEILLAVGQLVDLLGVADGKTVRSTGARL